MMNTKSNRLLTISALLLNLSINSAFATVLTFDIDPISNYQAIDQSYGDHVSSSSENGFFYGSARGFTPDVSVEYGDTDPALWTTGYGSLTNVLFEDRESQGILEITLSADNNKLVRLHQFQLAAYTTSFSEDPSINLVEIVAANGQVFSASDAVISKDSFRQFTFDPPLQSSTLTIRVDALNLSSLNDDISIDNIVFSQVNMPNGNRNIPIQSGHSGQWYNPERNGEGFFIEVLENDGLAFSWFTYDENGKQMWIVGSGKINDNKANIRSFVSAFNQPGPVFGPEYDKDLFELTEWGTIEFSFTSCGNAKIKYDSSLGFGSGSINLLRLTRIKETNCN